MVIASECSYVNSRSSFAPPGHCAPRGGGVKDLTAAARSALPGRSLTPSPDPAP
jgi:hypothetical protein